MKLSPQPSGHEPPERAKLKVGFEKLTAVARELLYLAERQQAEVGETYQPFAPDFDTYLALERANSLAVWTARTIEANVLVGYIIWRFWRGLHCVNTTFADGDLVYLAPDYREGWTGYKLLKSGLAAVRPRVDMIRIETNDLYEDGRMGVLLERLGLRRIGSVYQGRAK